MSRIILIVVLNTVLALVGLFLIAVLWLYNYLNEPLETGYSFLFSVMTLSFVYNHWRSK